MEAGNFSALNRTTFQNGRKYPGVRTNSLNRNVRAFVEDVPYKLFESITNF